MTIARLVAVSIDSSDPLALAGFWAAALGWDRVVDDDHVELRPTDPTTFTIRFLHTDTAKPAQNRIHVDLTTRSADDQADSVATLVAAGGRHVDIGQRPDETHVVLVDPEGNELCVIEPTNRFLASCPRLGAVNCDGTHALGVFFSRVLGWPLVWDHDEETAIQHPDGTGPKITWSGPPLMPRPPRERFHLHLAPVAGADVARTVDDLVALGATVDHSMACPGAVGIRDVDGNHVCVEPG
jgi:catechol 2,3-dioxygenase-like lactoylglutathione lyase family enzyme